MQKEYEQQEKLRQELDDKNKQLHMQKLKEDEQRIAEQQKKLKRTQDKLIKNAMNRIEKLVKNSKSESKYKAEAKRETIDETLKSQKYADLEKYNSNTLLLDMEKLKADANKYDYTQEEPVKIDQKYMKALEDVYKMEDDFDSMFGDIWLVPEESDPSLDKYNAQTTNTQSSGNVAGSTDNVLDDIRNELDDIDKIFADLNIKTPMQKDDPNPQAEM